MKSILRRRLVVPALVVASILPCAVLSPVAYAQDTEAPTQETQLDPLHRAVSALAAGDPGPALRLLEGETDLADTRRLHVLADRAWRYETRYAEADEAVRRRLATLLVERSEAAHALAPDDAHTGWSLALALGLGERVGLGGGADAWNRAATLLEELPGDEAQRRRALGYAISLLVEGGVAERMRRRRLFARADKLAHLPLADALRADVVRNQMWAARRLLDEQRTFAKDRTRAALDLIRDAAHAEPPDDQAATLWNDTVVFAEEQGFALGEGYVTRPEQVADGRLVLAVPRSARFVVAESSTTGERYVTELDADGEPVRQLLFRTYGFGTDHAFVGPNRVGGDNAKKLAEGLRDLAAHQLFDSDAKVSKIARGELNRDLDGWSFELSGTTREEQPRVVRVVGWCGRGTRQASHAVLLYLYGEDRSVGHAMGRIRASIREAGE